MKAVVVETKNEYSIVMDKRGRFIRLKNDGTYRVGQEIDITNLRRNSIYKRIASIAAMIVLVIGVSSGVYLYGLPYSYVNVDINPSMELTMNMFDRVIGARGFNEEGNDIIDGLKLRNKGVEHAIRMLVSSAREKEYIRENDENAMLFTVVSKDTRKTELLSERVIGSTSPETEDGCGISSMVQSMHMEQYGEAKEGNVSPGKMMVIEKILEDNPEVGMEELEKASIGEIMRNYKAGPGITNGNNDKEQEAKNRAKKEDENENKNAVPGRERETKNNGIGNKAIEKSNKDNNGNGKENMGNSSGNGSNKENENNSANKNNGNKGKGTDNRSGEDSRNSENKGKGTDNRSGEDNRNSENKGKGTDNRSGGTGREKNGTSGNGK